MKQKHFLIGVLLFISFSAFTTYTIVTGEYLTTAPEDPSFGVMIVDHDDEINSLENYYTNVAYNPSVVNDHNSLMSDFESVIVTQSDYMTENNLTFEQVRENPSLLPPNFIFSNQQHSQALNVINTTMPVASPDLQHSLSALREYIDLASQVNYSVLEIYDDSYGGGIHMGIGDEAMHLGGKQANQGLQSKEAIRKLRDLLKKDLLNLTKEQFTIYPNPLSNTSTISFLNSISGKSQFVLYDIKGRMITSAQKNLEEGTAHIQANEILDIQSLSKGIYILKINTTTGREMSNKLIVK
ncbi:hypothetical protein KORDIASMS9_02953 [Kordia sp. SMS9]|uniref:T9SS type A sorting domain-containing protein n=1 Tax=Kordia sp. SMS9 TaxID=2282170 RepID=UPI000E0DAC83|nr:T9SS type A sorting domain-containing protein [Kordia sp. SMS9]AXG70707.1 hypothetical protein KORDIASMS9_02953 [Kordia sp. SMS9]